MTMHPPPSSSHLRPPPQRLGRLLSLVPWLSAHPGATVSEAAAAFEVPEEVLAADIELLSWCSLPGEGPTDFIDVNLAGDKITLYDAQGLDKPLRLTGEEATALLAATRALAATPGLADRGALDKALALLESLAGDGEPDTLAVSEELARADEGVLAAVRSALSSFRRIRLQHRASGRDEITERDVDPVALHARDGHFYLQAWCLRSEGERLFRLDRVESAVVLGTAAEHHVAPWDLADGVYRGRPDDTLVTLELEASARWVAEQYPTRSRTELGRGRLRVELGASEPEWVVGLVLSLGGAARVISPPWLAQSVTRTAQEALKDHPV